MSMHTRWIETEFTNTIAPYAGDLTEDVAPASRSTVVVEVDGRRIEMAVPSTFGAAPQPLAGGPPKRPPLAHLGTGARGTDAVVVPMRGTVVKIAVSEGDQVVQGQPIAFLESIKMEQPLNAHKNGTVRELTASLGETVSAGMVLCLLVDTLSAHNCR